MNLSQLRKKMRQAISKDIEPLDTASLKDWLNLSPNTSDELILPEEYQVLIVYYALMMGLIE